MSLHHFNNKDLFVARAASVLKKEGVIIIVDWHKGVDAGMNEKYFSLKEENCYHFCFLLAGKKRSD